MIKQLKKIKWVIKYYHLPVIFSKTRFLSSLYYAFLSKQFYREHQSVLRGKVKHVFEARKAKSNYFLLIRNTHRIEKGLLMRPRRKIFAKDYIQETVDSFIGVWSSMFDFDNKQLKWCHDVLTNYFETNDTDPIVDKEAARFYSCLKEKKRDVTYFKCEGSLVPYNRQPISQSNISYDDFFKLTRHRRSVRWYLPKPVSRKTIDLAILAANQSPSACNRQPFEFRIFDDPELVKKVVKFPMGTSGYGHNIPVLAVIVGSLDAYYEERDRHLIYIDGSLAAMSFMFALETLGLSSCAINWPDIETREVKMGEFLQLAPYQRPVMCIGLGYPDPEGKVAYSEKRNINNVRYFNN